MRVKKFFVLILSLFAAVSLYGQAKYSVQVINQEAVNLSASEAAWLPGQVQDKLKSNLQEYLEMKTVVDSKSEKALKKLQAESEGDGRDEATAIELGKITTAKFALFTKDELEEALEDWLWKASHSRIQAIYEVQKKIRRHFQAIINTAKYQLSNARIEAINNKIKLSIRMAYGFRNIDNMLDLIMLRCSEILVKLPGRQVQGFHTY